MTSKIIADVKLKEGMAIKSFDDEEKFFRFATDVHSSDVEVLRVSKYFIGGELIPQEVIFDKKLKLRPLPVAELPGNEKIFDI